VIRSSLILILFVAWAGAAELPDLAPGLWECHGQVRLRGQSVAEPFWFRLLPSDPKFGGNRLLQLVYTPPPAAILDGTHLADAPFLLLDAHARLVAWNDRAGMSQIAPGPAGTATYVATRDRTPNDQSTVTTHERRLGGERGWELSVAPLLLALVWRQDSQAELPCVDLYGDAPSAIVRWHGTEVAIADQVFTISADPQGRLQRLGRPGEPPVLTITAWLKEGH
jgi:hypothetical protein